MQYGRDINEWVRLMQRKNNGGYANIWLIGDLKTNEIAKFEQGLKFQNLAKKKDGWFSGYNAPEDVRIENFECSTQAASPPHEARSAKHGAGTTATANDGKLD